VWSCSRRRRQPEHKPGGKDTEDQGTAGDPEAEICRTPATILEAQKTLASGGAPEDKPNERFRLQVVAGQWKDVGAFLQNLPEPQRTPVYEHVLKDLSRAPTPSPEMQNIRGPAPLSTLLEEDLLALADIAPGELTAAQLKLLGALLQRTLTAANGYIDPL
jgi:hypothetical protein